MDGLLGKFRRIAIVGSGGSGKSWLATRLAAATSYPLYHLDKCFLQPGWTMLPREVREAQQQEMMADAAWIIDGNWASSMPSRFAAADLVIFLDLSRLVCLWGALRRAGKQRPDMPDGIADPMLLSRANRAFYARIWAYPKAERPAVLALHEANPDTVFLRLRSRREVEQLSNLATSEKLSGR